MSTSQTAWLTKPNSDDKTSAGTFGYINARIRQRAYDLIIREFKKSGLTQAQLCRRWGKAPEVVSRFFARPANWELNTFSEALFAISGAVPKFETTYPVATQTTDFHQEIVTPLSTDQGFDFRDILKVPYPNSETGKRLPANNNYPPMPEVITL